MKESQSNLEEKVNPIILKDDFSSRTASSIFTSIESLLLDRSNETSFSNINTNKPLLAPVQCLADQIQVQKPIQVLATDQMPDHI